jgi:hypothetical protein
MILTTCFYLYAYALHYEHLELEHLGYISENGLFLILS